MPIKPMSPEEAINAFDIEVTKIYCDGRFDGNVPVSESRRFFRAALASVIAWAAEECRPKTMSPDKYAEMCKEDGDPDRNHAVDCLIRNMGIEDYHAALLKAAEEIKGV